MGKKKKKHRKHTKYKKPYGRVIAIASLAMALIVGAVILVHLIVTNNDESRDTVSKPVATIEMETGGIIKVELDPANAPNTVKNFIALAEQDFYNGLIFHRVIPNFMIQGGCPLGQGTGNPGYSIKGEFTGNGFNNPLAHERGVISMARSPHSYDSAGSQFFITVATSPHLDGQYAAFGKVIEGMDEVDRIVSVQTGAADKPLENQVIKRITVETFGVDYDEPDKN